jgi:Acylphosphatases
MMVKATIKVYGEVQGVGFRAWVARKALKLGLKGYVENMPDGSLLAVVEGGKAAVEQFVEECRRGPPLARVDGVEVAWSEYTGEFQEFEVRYSELELPR